MRLVLVAGARPNFMKIASLVHAIKEFPQIEYKIIHTGQHYDDTLSKVFFDELNIPKPHENLGIGSGTRDYQLMEVEKLITPILKEYKPDVVIVVGDVNSTLAAARAAKKLDIKVAHVEAGLRSFDMEMPEEVNRIATDEISDYLFITEESGIKNIKNTALPLDKAYFVGNTMIDTLISNLEKIDKRDIFENLGLEKGTYAVSTIHRPSNTDEKNALEKILNIWEKIQNIMTVVIPIHPRTEKYLELHGLNKQLQSMKNIKLIPPQGYLDFIHLIKNAKLVLTDSGGIQEETTFLEIPCITLRENTERPSTIDVGTNVLVGTNEHDILRYVHEIINGTFKKGSRIPDLWDGKAGKRIIEILLDQS